MQDDLMRIFGTTDPAAPYETLSLGRVRLTLQNGALRHLFVDGVEVIRNIAFVVRDRDWGTLVPELCELHRSVDDRAISLSFSGTYANGASKMSVTMSLDVVHDGLRFAAIGKAVGDFETNRTGFIVLHPGHIAGAPVSIEHSDKTISHTVFPELIDPWRPFMNIASMTHDYEGLRVRVDFTGDTFETEDQRQWGDASYKTYNRSLDLPWPYVVADGEVIEQSVSVKWEDIQKQKDISHSDGLKQNLLMPDLALVLGAQDAENLASDPSHIAHIAPQRLLCTVDGALGEMGDQIARCGALQSAAPNYTYDLELIFAFKDGIETEMHAVANAIKAVGLLPDSVLICPSVDRQSTPPGSDWPICPDLADIHAMAANVFSNLERGGGMVSFFPELNRKRPPLEHLDFVSHGLCAIVHASDDVSVMETLQNIQHITRSARAIMGTRSYRIGPCTIAMRQNPYGSRTIDNPNNARVAMAHDDPRHRGDFGAAYTIGLATALVKAGVAVWTPAAAFGPRGCDPNWPISTVLATLAHNARKPVLEATLTPTQAYLQIGNIALRANLTDQVTGDLSPYGWVIERI